MDKNEKLSLGCGTSLLAAICGPMFLLSVAGIVWGWSRIVEQHRLITSARTTTALIVSSEVEWLPGSQGQQSQYKPTILYQYSLVDESFQSTVVSPGREAGEHGWAEQMVRQFPAGQEVAAWYDPANPSVAFLLNEYQADPYMLTIWASLFAGFAVTFPASFYWPWPRLRCGMALVAAVIVEAPVIAAVTHYFEHASPLHDQAQIMSTAAIGLGAIPLLLALRWWFVDPQKVAAKQKSLSGDS